MFFSYFFFEHTFEYSFIADNLKTQRFWTKSYENETIRDLHQKLGFSYYWQESYQAYLMKRVIKLL